MNTKQPKLTLCQSELLNALHYQPVVPIKWVRTRFRNRHHKVIEGLCEKGFKVVWERRGSEDFLNLN